MNVHHGLIDMWVMGLTHGRGQATSARLPSKVGISYLTGAAASDATVSIVLRSFAKAARGAFPERRPSG